MQKTILSIGITLCLSLSAKAQKIAGVWLREGGAVMRISTTEHPNVFIFRFDGNSLTQTARLMAKGNGHYTGILERVNSGDGCTTYLNLTFQVNSFSQLTMTETGNDGNCDVPAGYEASFTATRKKG